MPAKLPPSSDNVLLGKGQVLFNRFDDSGLPTVWRHLGDVDQFDLSSSDTKVQKFSGMQASAPLYKEVITRRVVTLTLKGAEFAPDNTALLAQGVVSTLVQAATAIVDEPVADVTVPGSYYVTKLLGPVTAITMNFGATPGVLGTDYEIVDASLALIHILPGTILTGAVTISYTPTAYTGTTGPAVVGGGKSGKIEGAVQFIPDPTSGPAMKVDVWHVQVSPNGALSLIGDDFADLSLTMEVLDDSAVHAASPLYQITYLP